MRLRDLVWLGGLAGAAVLTGSAGAQETVDWSGFYAGIYAGYALDAGPASGSSIGPATADIGGTILNGTLASSMGRINGAFGGAAAGYNYQHNKLVLGLEAAAGLGALGKSDSSNLSLSVTDGVNTLTASYDEMSNYDINWYTSLVGRVGFAHENWLFSLKGGVVLVDASIKSTSRLQAADPGGLAGGLIGPGGIDLPGAANASQVLVGPTGGFGVETMIADNVSVGAEYSYMALPSFSAPSAGLGGLFGGGGGAFSTGVHQVKATLNYHF